MTKPFRDFLYLDNEIVSDLYGQIFQEEIIGKMLSTGNMSSSQKSDTTGYSESESSDANGVGSIGLISAGITNSESSSTSKEEQLVSTEEINSNESITMALNNFKYTKVVEKLQNSKLLKSSSQGQHEFAQISGSFEYYDFELDRDIFNFDKIIEFMYTTYYNDRNQFFDVNTIKSDYKNAAQSIAKNKVMSPFKSTQEAKDYYKKIDGMFSYRNMAGVSQSLSDIFQNTVILLSSNNEIVICSKKFLKTNSISLTMSKKINATVIGRVMNDPELPIDATKTENYIVKDSNGKPNTKSLLNNGAAFMVMNYLQHFVNLDPSKSLYIIQAIGVEYS